MSAAPNPPPVETPIDSSDPISEMKQALEETRALTREQLGAAWQLHADRIREQLESGWHEQIDRIFDERFAEVSGRLHQDFDRAVSIRAVAHAEMQMNMARVAAQRHLTEQLNHTARRLKNAESREVWIRTLLESTNGFCSRAALFAVNSKNLRFEGGKGIGDDDRSLEADIPVANAPAFQNVVDSKETVVAIGTSGELSSAIAEFLGDTASKKVFLFPILLRKIVVAVLYAEPGGEAEPVDVSALELLAALAANSMDTEEIVVLPPAPELIQIAPPIGARSNVIAMPLAAAEPEPTEGREQHHRAQRFARTKVAEFLLYKGSDVKSGRAGHQLYNRLRDGIDAARDAYRRQFPFMPDYLHQELVTRLANNDAALLGDDYPGPLA
jgi:hypothetical protein